VTKILRQTISPIAGVEYIFGGTCYLQV